MIWNAPCFLLFSPKPSSTSLSVWDIAGLENDGHDTVAAVELPKQLIEAQQDNEQDRDRLMSKLAHAS